jgi:hypothetical protein
MQRRSHICNGRDAVRSAHREKAPMRKLTVLLALLIATATVTPSLAYYHHHRHSWGGRCVTGAYWRWAPHHGYSGWGP